ncbi:hypothetical protein F5Y06DRAFT_90698 [Hypoxylon sp. FL0890]|nr:hypothetical protein F5Y06DRAFT_90698 [Hypoxylon sp. FL0890]
MAEAKSRVVRPQPTTQRAHLPPRSTIPRPTRINPSSPEYKQAARKYTQVLVALPILLVTSYFLFDRLVLGHEPKPRPLPQRPKLELEDMK